MYIPSHFRQDDQAALQAFIRQHSFATLSIVKAGRIEAVHLPLLLRDCDSAGRQHENGVLVGHLARANTLWQAFGPDTEALLVFSGAHAYISPRWYVTQPQVPTWNYMTVHAYGCPSTIDDPDWASQLLRESVEKYEAEVTLDAGSGAAEPAAWSFDEHLADVTRRLQYIVAFEIVISELQGCFKLNQHKKAGDRDGVISGLEESKNHAAQETAAQMRRYCH